ncbi:hypothetical protein BC939DRAFT_249738 [Gamsiella multidivaricata]|uniref:uncharacterized protein n=1 Tax=Gamsiella multidivaricata TaxID=101098 RepID=UPI0022206CD7|nr:uncharacterized protein BC939DRAFT_249738 [Gamsiella multidivaricata]KAI7819666.1 hypothetical protein BC939DRAFT_249738 [Gamsiella multidivaricata]
MPLVLSKRDPFISKFYETLALAKSAAISNGPESTSRLHIAELELFCNVFTETQYRDFKFKGEVTLFYTTVPNHPVEVTPFSRLPQFVGMIQTSDYGLRAILRSKTSLHRIGGPSIAAEDSNQFLDADAFQVHISELLANLQWTAYSFNPYQSPHLHISRVYMDTDYLYKTASSFSKAATLKAKGLRKIRESAGILTFSARSPSNQQYISGHQHRRSGSFSPLMSLCDAQSVPTSPRGCMIGRSCSIISCSGNLGYNAVGNEASIVSPTSPNKRFPKPTIVRRQLSDSSETFDRTDADSSSIHQPPPLPQPMAASTLRDGVSVMSLLIPGQGRKRGLLSTMVFGSGNKNNKILGGAD